MLHLEADHCNQSGVFSLGVTHLNNQGFKYPTQGLQLLWLLKMKRGNRISLLKPELYRRTGGVSVASRHIVACHQIRKSVSAEFIGLCVHLPANA